jgi:hypothetical protein
VRRFSLRRIPSANSTVESGPGTLDCIVTENARRSAVNQGSGQPAVPIVPRDTNNLSCRPATTYHKRPVASIEIWYRWQRELPRDWNRKELQDSCARFQSKDSRGGELVRGNEMGPDEEEETTVRKYQDPSCAAYLRRHIRQPPASR